ncbi:MAG TPA: pilus assembly protein N-terminal domain-containing protein, partial [Labilithrix sp.]
AACVLVTGCASPPPAAQPVRMQKIDPPAQREKRKLSLRTGDPGTVVGDVVAANVDDSAIARVVVGSASAVIVPENTGTTLLHVTTKDGEVEDIEVHVAAGDPLHHAVGVGESFVVPMANVKDYSVGLPDVVLTSLTTDGKNLVVTGRKEGRTTLVLFSASGSHTSHQIVALGSKG